MNKDTFGKKKCFNCSFPRKEVLPRAFCLSDPQVNKQILIGISLLFFFFFFSLTKSVCLVVTYDSEGFLNLCLSINIQLPYNTFRSLYTASV